MAGGIISLWSIKVHCFSRCWIKLILFPLSSKGCRFNSYFYSTIGSSLAGVHGLWMHEASVNGHTLTINQLFCNIDTVSSNTFSLLKLVVIVQT